ncbi:IS66 family insertion sequence element accessory protein TnpB, partial [Bradyrhizobium sp. CIR3A]|uniref:IS66 family insertion sequence element accessory protein TnpB n=1 Tax=Bradyrhizobium sp. CIR3A TaxID=2663838 RepID=UPI001AEE521A
HPSDRNTDERDGSPSQAATGLMNRSHFRLSYKRLEKAKFCWPRIGHHRVQLTSAQLMALVDGMDWKRVRAVPVRPPEIVG